MKRLMSQRLGRGSFASTLRGQLGCLEMSSLPKRRSDFDPARLIAVGCHG